MGGEKGDWLEEKGGGCWWEGEEGDLMEEEGGPGWNLASSTRVHVSRSTVRGLGLLE